MSWHNDLISSVYTRLTGDSTLSGLTTVSSEWPKNDQTMPYVVLTTDTAGTEEAFTGKGIYVDIDVHVFHEKKAVGDTLSTCSLIMDRIEGDWLTNGGTPTFGLERWAPSVSGWTSSSFIETEPRSAQHEEGVWHFVSTFETLLSKEVTGP